MRKESKYDGFKKLCTSCKHQGCCTSFAAPLLFATDIQKLREIGKDGDAYTKEVIIEGKKARVIRKKPNSSLCTFWDEKNKTCSIYKNRPFDCMMYPFDIFWINGKYHWVLYSCNPHSNWQWTEEILTMFESSPQFQEVVKNISVFANLDEIDDLKASHELSYTMLREVNFNKLVTQV